VYLLDHVSVCNYCLALGFLVWLCLVLRVFYRFVRLCEVFFIFAHQSKPGVPPPSASGGHGTGRANMLARFCSKQREAQSAPPVAKVGEDKPAYIGRGCALLNLKSEPP